MPTVKEQCLCVSVCVYAHMKEALTCGVKLMCRLDSGLVTLGFLVGGMVLAENASGPECEWTGQTTKHQTFTQI